MTRVNRGPLGWRWWRRSLLTRVVTATIALSIVVMSVLGLLLLSRITTGLLDARQVSAVTEASAGLAEAQRLMDAADTGATTPAASRLVDAVVSAMAARAGTPGLFDVLLLSSSSVAGPERGTNLVTEASVPPELRSVVAQSQRQAWTYTQVRSLDGRSAPGLVIGGPIAIPGIGPYELYFLFPLTQEQQTLDLIRGAVVVTGLLLVGLVALIAGLVTRQVVAPVRSAARTAGRLSDGALHERLAVRGEDDLAQLAASFNDMAESIERQITQLENLSTVQQRFVSDVSHELRTPLTTIRMAADVMFENREAFDPQTARSAELLQMQLDQFETLLVDLLEISRFDAQAATLDVAPIDVAEVTQRVLDSSADFARSQGRPLVLTVLGEDASVFGDERRISRILRNLVNNAVEHGDERGVQVTVGADESCVAVSVRDCGVGLSSEESSLVFERFWRADPARARTSGGTGLGLAIALEDARLHGGWLEAWGEPGKGACFRLTLPRSPHGDLTSSPLPLLLDQEAPGDPQHVGVAGSHP